MTLREYMKRPRHVTTLFETSAQDVMKFYFGLRKKVRLIKKKILNMRVCDWLNNVARP